MSIFSRTSQKWIKRVIILTLSSVVGYLPQALANGAQTLVVGNDAHTGPYDRQGPTGEGITNTTISLSGNQTVIFYRSSTLQPSNVSKWVTASSNDGSNAGTIYCTTDDNATGQSLVLENNLQDSGLIYGGHKLSKTNIQGLYYTLRIDNLGTWKIGFTPNPLYVGDYTTPVPLTRYDKSGDAGCAGMDSNSGYMPIGGFIGGITVEFYNDATFDPQGAETISLLNNGGYSFRIYNPNPGAGIISYHDTYTIATSNFKISLPTCSAAVLSGNSVNGSTVSMGSYSPNSIINGANPVPFNIELSGCTRVRNIAVKLISSVTGTDTSLLGNTLVTGKAEGVGLEIKGLKTSYSNEMVLIPNDDTSVYHDYEEETDTSSGIAGSGGTIVTTGQSLKFQATMKRDSNQKILSGKFYATGIFSITYP
ncbi:fimbrial protein [Citrobacter cronae]|uniref:fimbrial protein n=1 Tax=Citrobacter cronae TaxID=1748967 RepID=UPI0021D0C8D7|nr:fimbrial protein [Citrobacter cronae]MCU6173943.1 fimbrial protein [Citrobacter cronae]